MMLLFAATLLASACCEKPPVTPKPNLVGVWQGAWMEGYVNEWLMIQPIESSEDRYWLHVLLMSDVGDPAEAEFYATFVDNALLLDTAHNIDGYKFLVLSLEQEGEELALVAYPHGEALMDAGDVPFAFRRRPSDARGGPQWFIDQLSPR